MILTEKVFFHNEDKIFLKHTNISRIRYTEMDSGLLSCLSSHIKIMLIKISSALKQSMHLPQTIIETEASHILLEISRNAAKN